MATVPSGTRFIGIATSVDLTERKSAVLNKTTEPFTIEDIASSVGVGAQGPQGVQGPAGPLGPVGPAGLNWQGAWTSGTSYVADDAVGYDGASWFCILATSGTTTPDLDTTHWALLASQGAQGPQGVQGPTGPQGPAGASPTGTYTSNLIAVTSFPYPEITTTSVRVASTATNQRVALPSNVPFGTEIRVGNKSVNTIIVYSGPYSYCYLNGIGSTLGFIQDIEIPAGKEYTFVYITTGTWSAYFSNPNLQQITNIGNTIINGAITTTLQGSYLSILDTNFLGTEIYKDSIRLRKLNLSGDIKNIELVSPTNISDDRTITLPDASGTLALRNYKSYVSYIQFSSDGSVDETSLFNDLDLDIYFQLESTGVYIMSSALSLLTNKTVINPFDMSGSAVSVRLPIFNDLTGLISGYYSFNRLNNSTIKLYFWNTSNDFINPYTLLNTKKILADIRVYA